MPDRLSLFAVLAAIITGQPFQSATRPQPPAAFLVVRVRDSVSSLPIAAAQVIVER